MPLADGDVQGNDGATGREFQGSSTEHEKDFPIPRAGWARLDLGRDGSPASGLLLSKSGVRKSPCSRWLEPSQSYEDFGEIASAGAKDQESRVREEAG